MKKITLADKNFRLFISAQDLKSAITFLADKINHDYSHKSPVFLCVLNGSFIFASELIKQFKYDCKVSFIKLSSYQGIASTGNIRELIGLNENLNQKDVIIVEDIVDSGATVANVVDNISKLNPRSIEVATLLFKPKAYQKNIPINYSAVEVGNEFLVGFGLDYNGLGRNLEEIYIID
jgi:hypoxanthine phosphoribosyltransferase|tara:strand:+ start:768 stop:1301 length:534 start_codon:yes stop_codon:yes gene_type:complete